uniref:Selection and upkeep of intraepithelial T-cells protein 2 n=1 Tax=Lygus hesperus TaxID=30085 RepID=A0A0A9ZAM2_LYGHE
MGAAHLLRTLVRFLSMRDESGMQKPAIAMMGFSKLLSCNRVPPEHIPHVLARLFLHHCYAQTQRKHTPVQEYLYELLSKFFRSFAASHAKRQCFCASAGLLAFRTLFDVFAANLLSNKQRSISAFVTGVRERCQEVVCVAKLIEFVCRLTDAFLLTHIRDIDP